MDAMQSDLYAQRWLVLAFDVLTLDGLWTRHLHERNPDTEPYQLGKLGQRLHQRWLDVTEEAELSSIGHIATKHVERMDPGLVELPGFPGRLVTPEQILDSALRNAEVLSSLRDDEAERLFGKTLTLSRGEWPTGDLSSKARCTLLALSIGITYLLGDALAAAALGYWFMQSQCPHVLLGFPPSEE
ncbi:hypothetical protein [Streptomyces pseudogriseolus]|uniref:hypothetical protein n=1 Tax=Streptomyces pseudogriseolus TaxID=36817 RepID=UPI003FA2C0B3